MSTAGISTTSLWRVLLSTAVEDSPLSFSTAVDPRLATFCVAVMDWPSFQFTVICRGLADSWRSEEHTSELQSRSDLVCRLLLEKKKKHFISSAVFATQQYDSEGCAR